ncbi:MAG: 4-hydroxyphenylpyruvate dioxygenase [Thiohalomonadales bacterium]
MNTSESFVEVSGLSFLEFSGSKPKLLTDLFEQMGLKRGGGDDLNRLSLYYQEDIRFISNPGNGGNTEVFRSVHGRGASAMGFKVADGEQAYKLALELGAEPADQTDYAIPAIKGVGKSLIYLVDEAAENTLFSMLNFTKPDPNTVGETCLQRVDHLTHNLNLGNVEPMSQFYENIFGFKRIRSFHIEGKKTGLFSQVVASRCGKIIIPLNETKDDKSQIAEFIREYNGEGIQHIALTSTDIYKTVDKLSANGISFQDTPDTYYDLIESRLPGHGENVEKLKKDRILVDGGEAQGGGYLLQIFTKNSIGPIFFEYIQRKGNKGFGEGNFQALFDSIELDQERRGVL